MAKVAIFHHWAEHLIAWRIKESHASSEEPLKMLTAKLGLTYATQRGRCSHPYELIVCCYTYSAQVEEDNSNN